MIFGRVSKGPASPLRDADPILLIVVFAPSGAHGMAIFRTRRNPVCSSRLLEDNASQKTQRLTSSNSMAAIVMYW